VNKKLPGWAVILAVCVCAVLLLSGVNSLTKDRIERQAAISENAVRARLVSGAERFEPVELQESRYSLDSVYAGLSEAGETLGYVGQTTVTGYGGPVEVTVGVDMTGVITGIEVGGDRFSETPGLGALTREAAFTDQFPGRTAGIVLNQDGVDTVSGASISSRAVVSGVNAVAGYICAYPLGLTAEENASYEGETVSAVVKGFGGDVTVTMGFADDGTVAYLAVDTPNETDGMGKLASEPAFTGQFLGRSAPFTYGEDGVDAVTGATITSNAVLGAVNALAAGGEGGVSASVGTESGAQPAAEDVSRFMRARPVSASAAPEAEAAAEDASRFMRARPVSASAAPEAEAAAEDASRFMRARPVFASAAPEAETAEEDASRFMRARPVSAAAEPEAEAAEEDVSRFMRARPVSAAAAPEAETAEEDASRFMRARPVFALAAPETETAEEDASRFMRERPVSASAAPEAEAAEEDASRFMRARPVSASAAPETETAEEDASRFMRARPVFAAAVPEAEDAAEDVSRFMRPRPD